MLKINNEVFKNEVINYSYGKLTVDKQKKEVLDIEIISIENNLEKRYFFESAAFIVDLSELKNNEYLVHEGITDFLYSENGKLVMDLNIDNFNFKEDISILYKKLDEKKFEIKIEIDKILFYYEGIIVLDRNKVIYE